MTQQLVTCFSVGVFGAVVFTILLASFFGV